jgi:hypothetical protein
LVLGSLLYTNHAVDRSLSVLVTLYVVGFFVLSAFFVLYAYWPTYYPSIVPSDPRLETVMATHALGHPEAMK